MPHEEDPGGVQAAGHTPQSTARSPATAATPSRKKVVLLVALMVTMLIATRLLPPREVPFSICLVRNMTGFPCPSCGMSRGYHAMSSLSPVEAFGHNIAAPLVYPASWIILLLGLIDLTLQRGLLIRLWQRIKKPVLLVLLPLMAASWVINLTAHLRTRSALESLANSLPGRLVGYLLSQL